MNNSLDKTIESVKSMGKDDDARALVEADLLIDQHPSEAKVWSLRSYLHARQGRYENALADMTEAAKLAPEEIAYRFNRGRYHIHVESFDRSIEDFSDGLALCDRHQHDYYRDALYFLRAFSYVKIGDKHAATKDLDQIADDDYSFWVDDLVSKKDLLKLCR